MSPTQKMLVKFAAQWRQRERAARIKYRAAIRANRPILIEGHLESIDFARRCRAGDLRCAAL
jgi:hypothetical protein